MKIPSWSIPYSNTCSWNAKYFSCTKFAKMWKTVFFELFARRPAKSAVLLVLVGQWGIVIWLKFCQAPPLKKSMPSFRACKSLPGDDPNASLSNIGASTRACQSLPGTSYGPKVFWKLSWLGRPSRVFWLLSSHYQIHQNSCFFGPFKLLSPNSLLHFILPAFGSMSMAQKPSCSECHAAKVPCTAIGLFF